MALLIPRSANAALISIYVQPSSPVDEHRQLESIVLTAMRYHITKAFDKLLRKDVNRLARHLREYSNRVCSVALTCTSTLEYALHVMKGQAETLEYDIVALEYTLERYSWRYFDGDVWRFDVDGPFDQATEDAVLWCAERLEQRCAVRAHVQELQKRLSKVWCAIRERKEDAARERDQCFGSVREAG